jgi:hypothetical protein
MTWSLLRSRSLVVERGAQLDDETLSLAAEAIEPVARRREKWAASGRALGGCRECINRVGGSGALVEGYVGV